MRRTSLFLLLFAVLTSVVAAAAEEKQVFGPVKYEVKERYGKENRSKVTVAVPEGSYVIKAQNGEKPAERPDLMEFTVNGEKLLAEQHCDYRYLACFVDLRAENTYELVLKDYTPTGFKRPPATPRNVTITILPAPVKLPKIVLGLNAWEDLNNYAGLILKIKSPEVLSFALAAADLQNSVDARATAMRRLADRKDPVAQDFLLHVYRDFTDSPDVRGEAALALGFLRDTSVIPSLIQGLLDPEEKIRSGSARALSLYKEEDTKEPLSKTLERMDIIMKGAVVRTLVSAGWRPVSTLMGLAASQDPSVANMGVELLAGSRDERVVDLLLSYLDNPGVHDRKLVIAALGQTKSSKAVEQLSRLAADPDKRKGVEAELGMALANLGDPKSEELIVAMIKKTDTTHTRNKLIEAYKKLTGKEYK
jgi:HEAT repeat protein